MAGRGVEKHNTCNLDLEIDRFLYKPVSINHVWFVWCLVCGVGVMVVMVLRMWENWSQDDPIISTSLSVSQSVSQSCLTLCQRPRGKPENNWPPAAPGLLQLCTVSVLSSERRIVQSGQHDLRHQPGHQE